MVVVSVPIDATEPVIRAIGPRLRDDALLMDVTSIKEAPVAAMLASTRASVVGTHPMFGPNVHSLQGQRVVVCRARGDEWANWVARMLQARGLMVQETTPAHHDRIMSVVQVLTHFQTQVLGLTLARLGTPLDETLRFTSPAYLMELYVTARHFDQSPRPLWADRDAEPGDGARDRGVRRSRSRGGRDPRQRRPRAVPCACSTRCASSSGRSRTRRWSNRAS